MTISPTQALQKISPLVVNNGRFLVNGKEVILRGASANHFVWNLPRSDKVGLDAFIRDIELLRSWGGNFLVVPINSAYLLNDPAYQSNLKYGLSEAKRLGFRIYMPLHSRGESDKNSPTQLFTADENLAKDWRAISTEPALTALLKENVDMIGVLSEPANISANDWRRIADSIIAEVRHNLGYDIPAAISGIDVGSDLNGVTGNLPDNTALDFHTYYTHRKQDFPRIIADLKAQGIMTFSGEMGWKDTNDQVDKLLSDYNALGVSYALWAFRRGDENELLDRLGQPRPNAISLKEHLTPN